MRLNKYLSILLLNGLFVSLPSYAEIPQIETQEPASLTQRWFDRTDFVFTLQSDNKPIEGVETVQPLFANELSTVFWPGRLAYNNTSTTVNLGLGYRYLTTAKNLLWGLNIFYDEDIRFDHNRFGLGGELFTHYFTFRANYYDVASGPKFISGRNERALNGIDFSVETPVPFVPWTRLVLEAYYWDGWVDKNIKGGYAAFRAYPTRNLELDLGLARDTSQGTQGFLSFNLYIGKPAFIEYSATTSKMGGAIPVRKLEDFRLQKVYRHNDMVIERTSPGKADSETIVSLGN